MSPLTHVVGEGAMTVVSNQWMLAHKHLLILSTTTWYYRPGDSLVPSLDGTTSVFSVLLPSKPQLHSYVHSCEYHGLSE